MWLPPSSRGADRLCAVWAFALPLSAAVLRGALPLATVDTAGKLFNAVLPAFEATAAMDSAVVCGNGRVASRWESGCILGAVVLPCCRTTYVNFAIVSASFTCWALKCVLKEVAKLLGEREPTTVCSGACWFKLRGIMSGSSSGRGWWSAVETVGVCREVREAISAGFELKSCCEGCEVGERGPSIDTMGVSAVSLSASLSLLLALLPPICFSLVLALFVSFDTPFARARPFEVCCTCFLR